jgi:hypothetical protein
MPTLGCIEVQVTSKLFETFFFLLRGKDKKMSNGLLVRSRVARWFIFKTIIPIGANFRGI